MILCSSLMEKKAFGRFKIYTSGCPNNQNRCQHSFGSPPDETKNDVLKFQLVISIVIAPSNTGRDSKC